MVWMIKTIWWAVKWMVLLSLLATAFAFFLAFNCFTIPFFLAEWAVCKLLKRTPPHIAFYFVTAYPTWNCGPHATFFGDLRKMNRDANRRVKTTWDIGPWEARFFD